MTFCPALPRRASLPLALLTLVAALLHPTSAAAQAMPAGSDGPALSRADLYVGYGYFKPFNSDIGGHAYPAIPAGVVSSLSGYFTPRLGLQLEGSYFPSAPEDNNCAYSAQAGPVMRFPRGRLIPFAHALGGTAAVGGPIGQRCNTWGWGVTGGGGADFVLPLLHEHLAARIQADFTYSRVDNGPMAGGGFTGGLGEIYAVRPSAGLVYRFGNLQGTRIGPPALLCSADPTDPYPGDPLTISANTLNLGTVKDPVYYWTASAGKIAGDGAVAAVDTHNLPPGTYNVTGKLMRGDRQKLIASCTTSFTIQAYAPPTLTCSADRAAINSGDPVIITSKGRSPQGRPLTYSYTASNGIVIGTGTTGALSTNGATPGTITVTCRATDDRGQAGIATASVVVATPHAPAPIAQARGLCGLTFDRDRKRPDRVDNEAKGCLDDIALTLNRDAGTRLLMVGNHAELETNRDAAERVMNASDYLTREKGIDAARLDLRIGTDRTRTVSTMLIPQGAAVNAGAASAFDPTSVKRSGPSYGVPGQHTTTRSRRAVTHRTVTHRTVTHRTVTHRTVTHRKRTRRPSTVPMAIHP